MQNNPVDDNLELNKNQGTALQQLDSGQKIAIVVLVFFAVLVVFVWIVQTKQSLSGHYRSESIQATNQTTTCSGGNCTSQNEADLHLKDTDKDGLSDYDELNVYGTSPYLEDSDSDGYSDGQEVNSQNDPNCPFGQQCHIVPSVANQDTNLLKNTQEKDNSLNNLSTQLGSVENILNGQSDASSLRALLLESGADQEMINQISDEDLMRLYQDTLAK